MQKIIFLLLGSLTLLACPTLRTHSQTIPFTSLQPTAVALAEEECDSYQIPLYKKRKYHISFCWPSKLPTQKQWITRVTIGKKDITFPDELPDIERSHIKKSFVGDFNFDGYNDVALWDQASGNNNIITHILLYKPKEDTFAYNKALSRLHNITIHPSQETISSFSYGGPGSFVYTKYQWKGETLEEVLFSEQSLSQEQSKTHTFHLINRKVFRVTNKKRYLVCDATRSANKDITAWTYQHGNPEHCTL